MMPAIGVRIKLMNRGAGRWADSSGDNSKFGLRIDELLQVINLLNENNLGDAFKLIHFHIGSQISNIESIKESMQEIARFYAEINKMGVRIDYVDVGGGL